MEQFVPLFENYPQQPQQDIDGFGDGLKNPKFSKRSGGYTEFNFEDYSGQACRMAESSNADMSTIWFGLIKGNAMMQLNQSQAADLADILNHFAENGVMPESLNKIK